jgi:hypothetical protein
LFCYFSFKLTENESINCFGARGKGQDLTPNVLSIGTSYNRHGVAFNASWPTGDSGRTKWQWGANWHSHARGYNPNFSDDDLLIMKDYQSYGLTWHMSYQDSDGSRLIHK